MRKQWAINAVIIGVIYGVSVGIGFVLSMNFGG